ncbi:hypothetical protein PPYR_10055 [Photinus pyralis]|uniref:TPPP family protein n=1 Tax=Photinus pyralis TaxID=7054 RepID=A0A5N4AFA6_PHOPY|nr:TPPP family protein CG45057-like [Photinus pyralis]KAB0795994.1 hypothetical protein PPYR_10055 [Photinus pyralis]
MAQGGISLEEIFSLFAKFGDTKSDGKVITLTNADKWLKQAQVVDGKKMTTTDTGIAFNKLKSKTITFKQFMEFIEDLAKSKNMNVEEIKTKLLACSIPGGHGVTVR